MQSQWWHPISLMRSGSKKMKALTSVKFAELGKIEQQKRALLAKQRLEEFFHCELGGASLIFKRVAAEDEDEQAERQQ